jgi:prevent-host-death family protein
MKTISIRELHEKTGEYIRRAAVEGELLVTDRGKTVARILPHGDTPEVPYFARRVITPGFRKLMKSGKLRGGTDATQIVSDDRDRSVK